MVKEQIDRTGDDLADEQDLLSSEDSPYDQGWRAGNNQQGWTTQDNPYTKGDRQYEMWFNGFWDGRDTQGVQVDDADDAFGVAINQLMSTPNDT